MSGRRRSLPASAATGPLPDRWLPLAWRAARLVGPREADFLLRFAPDRMLAGFVPRLAAMGIEQPVAAAALARVRRLADWPEAWMWAAQQALGDARQSHRAGDATGVARNRLQAGLAFHAAGWPPPDARTLKALRTSSALHVGEALAVLDPGIRRVAPSWRTQHLPGLLAYPPGGGAAAPPIVVLNGATTAKEETIAWRQPFLRRGLAVLALDWPGTGEAAVRTTATADCLDLLDGVVDLARADPALDENRLACVGVSVGGAQAIRLAAADGRVRAAVAVTPPFDARPWLPRLGPLLRAQLVAHAGGAEQMEELAAGFVLNPLPGRHRPPALVFGAGRDLVVPPGEAVALAASLGDDATLLWDPRGGHCLFGDIPAWTADAAAWLEVLLASASTRVDTQSPPVNPRKPGSSAASGTSPAG